MIKLSIMILTTKDREAFLEDLTLNIMRHKVFLYDSLVQIMINEDETGNIGTKRNNVLQASQGEYVCFIDDDDQVSEDYVNTIITALNENPDCDCLSLRGIMTTDGEDPQVFEHSLKYNEWVDNGSLYPNVRYERYPNHLNVIKSSIAKQFKYPEANHGEDHNWSKRIHESGLIKNEVYIDKVLYYYKYRSNK